MTFNWDYEWVSTTGYSAQYWMLFNLDGSEFLEIVIEGNDGNIYFTDLSNNIIYCKSISEAKLLVESILVSEIRNTKLNLLV